MTAGWSPGPAAPSLEPGQRLEIRLAMGDFIRPRRPGLARRPIGPTR